MVGDCVEPAQHRDEVEFYSIYLGEPGSYQWVQDFESRVDALYAAYSMAADLGCKIDRIQYNAMKKGAPL
jgi:hypothetical protein